jgi:oligosaccharide repeat unit polymerase
VVYILAYTGRDGIVFWILTFVIEYNIFKEYLDKAQLKKSLRLPLLCIVFCMAILFIDITKARFGETLGEIVEAIVSYMGQQVSNFSDRYSIDPPISYGRTSFPLFVNIAEAIGIGVPYIDVETIRAYYSSQGLYFNVFATFVGSFLTDFGKLGTISILLLTSIYMTWTINGRARKVWYLSDLLLLLLYCQIISWGVFYFQQYSANFYLIVFVTIAFIFRVLRKSEKGRKEFIYPIQL